MIESLISSLLLTIIFESISSYMLGIKKINELKKIALINIYTNPIVVFLSNMVYLINDLHIYYVSIFILELGAIVLEFLMYKRYLNENIRYLRLSIYNNIFSFSMGIVLLIIREMIL